MEMEIERGKFHLSFVFHITSIEECDFIVSDINRKDSGRNTFLFDSLLIHLKRAIDNGGCDNHKAKQNNHQDDDDKEH